MSVDSVFYVLGSLFNLLSISHLTHSLNCIVSFTEDSVILQDRSSGRTIATGCESNGLYWLSYPSYTCFLSTDPLTVHAQLSHPNLAKLQQLVPHLSKLSSLPCELCQLRKHTRSLFPDRINSRASSPFMLVDSDV